METDSSSTSKEEDDSEPEDNDDTPEEGEIIEPEIPPRIPTPEVKKEDETSSEEEDFEIKAAAIYVDDQVDNLNELVAQNKEE